MVGTRSVHGQHMVSPSAACGQPTVSTRLGRDPHAASTRSAVCSLPSGPANGGHSGGKKKGRVLSPTSVAHHRTSRFPASVQAWHTTQTTSSGVPFTFQTCVVTTRARTYARTHTPQRNTTHAQHNTAQHTTTHAQTHTTTHMHTHTHTPRLEESGGVDTQRCARAHARTNPPRHHRHCYSGARRTTSCRLRPPLQQ